MAGPTGAEARSHGGEAARATGRAEAGAGQGPDEPPHTEKAPPTAPEGARTGQAGGEPPEPSGERGTIPAARKAVGLKGYCRF